MKEWWNNLALREKQTLSVGIFFLSLFLIYILLWSPLNTKVMSLRSHIQQNQELLTWMDAADKRIQVLEKTAQTKPAARPTGSLLSVIQKQINRTPLVTALTQLHQVDNESVQLTFEKVNFDQLITWLTGISQQGLLTTQLSITPGTTLGVVSADLIIKT